MTLGSFGFIHLLTGLEGRKVFISSLSIVNMVFGFLRDDTVNVSEVKFMYRYFCL